MAGGSVGRILAVVVASVAVVAGCGTANPAGQGAKVKPASHTRRPVKPKPAQGAPSPSLASTAQEYFEALTVGGTRLEAGTSHGGRTYKGMNIGLLVEGVADNDRYGLALVGNHAQILAARFIQTPVGVAYLAVSERTPPAASGSDQTQYQYWIAVYRANPQRPGNDLAYCIVATLLSGTPNTVDRSALLSLLDHWQVPSAK